jgi:hypothetical protein
VNEENPDVRSGATARGVDASEVDTIGRGDVHLARLRRQLGFQGWRRGGLKIGRNDADGEAPGGQQES